MHRLLLVLLITTGAISLSGCGFFNRNSDDVAEDPATPTEQTTQPVETSEGELPDIPGGEDSGNVVAVSENSPTIVARDLIQSTDPNERAIGVERTRNDPFAELTIPLIPPEPILPEDDGTTATNAGTETGRTVAAGPGTVGPGSNNPQQRPDLAEQRRVESGRAEIAALPEIPQPTTARAVRVSGVIQIGGSPYAIVKAPNEIERYVRQGERIAGGSVVVKRIDTGSAEPRVILVENGIEVERFVTSTEEAPVEEEPAAETVSTIGALPTLPSPAGI
ncbi:hypothetical protein D0962_05385 [Leptolyngbyaceae cyanobacterium CCMR0082]|uniref:Uncharacterized protein n=2 Tax=Adonisia turfae TaxID=2950184 RepID=A0A6M0S291_9CYAN|nr:hypothetical protein [Adonisia turfae]MDV3347533.1 hypothetical protein [Leptothoe sp. LEGE 181152]NEZ59315.1 hypothetical protein [Adonisia turfae CCMR0081]NEZ62213.1 hypothetical protein [Adonisia turfae CCMR0082]